MNETNSETITLGAQVGGKDASAITTEPTFELRQVLQSVCHGPYSELLDEFALVLRIDGEIQSWERSGVAYVRIQKKLRYATADIFMPASVWKSPDKLELRRFLADQVVAAITQICARAANVKVPVDAARLLNDVQTATNKFLNQLQQ